MLNSVKWLATGGAVILVVGMGIALFARCDDTDADAERTVTSLYDAIARGDYETAAGFYHPDLIATNGGRNDFIAGLKSINGKLGQRLGGHRTGGGVRQGGDSGADLTYAGEYENGDAIEVFRLVRVADEYLITAHTYQSDVLPR